MILSLAAEAGGGFLQLSVLHRGSLPCSCAHAVPALIKGKAVLLKHCLAELSLTLGSDSLSRMLWEREELACPRRAVPELGQKTLTSTLPVQYFLEL